jgi:hypothetical protein
MMASWPPGTHLVPAPHHADAAAEGAVGVYVHQLGRAADALCVQRAGRAASQLGGCAIDDVSNGACQPILSRATAAAERAQSTHQCQP